MQNPLFKRILWAFWLLVICLPLINAMTGFINSGTVRGADKVHPDIDCTLSTWFDGTFQNQKDKYWETNLGFRPDFIRLHNQTEWSLFSKFHSGNLRMGKNSMMYDNGCLLSYAGYTYKGEAPILKRIAATKYLQDTLAKLGKTLLVVIAPGKAFYYPQDVPDTTHYNPLNNYTSYKKLSAEYHINTIDFNDWFCTQKTKAAYPLMSHYGVHWTAYGATLAMDSVFHYLEHQRHESYPDLKYTWRESYNPEYSDNDAEKAMNLMFPLPREENFAYPMLSPDSDTTKKRPNMIVTGDSFGWQWVNLGLPQRVCREFQFWYYFMDAWGTPIQKNIPRASSPRSLDLQGEFRRTDAIIVLATEMNLHSLGWDMIENAAKSYGYKAKK